MYKRIRFYVSIFVSILLLGCEQAAKQNPYNLPLVTDVNEYLESVKENPKLELVDLDIWVDEIVLDIRYATTDNFTGEVIYTAPKAYARKPVAEALVLVQDSLSKLGLGLKIYDAYRPYSATVKFYEVYPDKDFVADPAFGSRHNRGCAVDVSLVERGTSNELPMPTEFDSFTEMAHPEYMDLPDSVIANRTLLFVVMEHFGFTHYPTEWWHFDFEGWEDYPLMDLSFDNL